MENRHTTELKFHNVGNKLSTKRLTAKNNKEVKIKTIVSYSGDGEKRK